MVNIYIVWVNYNDLTVLPNPGLIFWYREIIPFYGRKIQVSEILQFTQIYGGLGIYWGCTGIWWDIQGSMKGISVYYIMVNPN